MINKDGPDSQQPVSSNNHIPGLDFDFLRYIDVVPENQRRIQAFYLPYFAGCRKVLDLGCGDGDFVALLKERGVDVLGIDTDEKACAAGTARGLPIMQADVFSYLEAQAPESVDGIFSAHMVEHLAYADVIRLIELAYRVLRPGGSLVLATPDTRSIFSHLEMFYLHFGHISFYHPRLLCFFLSHAGFRDTQYGTNPETASPLLAAVQEVCAAGRDFSAGIEPLPAPPEKFLPATQTPAGLLPIEAVEPPAEPQPEHQPEAPGDPGTPLTVAYQEVVPLRGPTWLHRLSHDLRRRLVAWLLKPELDALAASANAAMTAQEARVSAAFEQARATHKAALWAQQKQMQAQQDAIRASQERVAVQLEILRTSQHRFGAETATALMQLASALGQEAAWRREQMLAIETELRSLNSDVRSIVDALQSINGPFECYATARKPNGTDRDLQNDQPDESTEHVDQSDHLEG